MAKMNTSSTNGVNSQKSDNADAFVPSIVTKWSQ